MFDRYTLDKNGDGHTVTLYLSQGLAEFADEPGNSKDTEQQRLESNVRRYVQEKFPDLKVTTAKVMMGTMLLSTIPLAASGTASAASIQITFTDIQRSYAKQAILDLHRAQVIMGYPDGTFRPTGKMTREEFSVLLAKSMGLTIDHEATSDFYDVSPWAQPYVAALQKAGLTSGRAQYDYGAQEEVTREELAVFYIRALGLSNQAMAANFEPNFADSGTISDWARAHVAFAQEIGFIEGIRGEYGILRFSPQAKAERQQVAVLANKFFQNRQAYTDAGNAILESIQPRIFNNIYVNRMSQGSFAITGTGKMGNTVTLKLTDGTTTRTLTTTVGEDRTYLVYADFTPFADGNVDVIATHTDAEGNTTGSATLTMQKDTTIVTPTITDPVPITEANRNAYVITGKAEPGALVRVVVGKFIDLPAAESLSKVVQADIFGNFTVTFDVAKFADGDVFIRTSQQDLAGNLTPLSDPVTVSKEVPDTLPAPTLTPPQPITLANHMRYVLSGTGAPNSRVEVTAVDGAFRTENFGLIAMSDAGGRFSGTLVPRQLANGLVTFSITMSNANGDTSAPTTITVRKEVENLPIPQLASTEPITNTNLHSYVLSGTGVPGANVHFVLTDERNFILPTSARVGDNGAFATTVGFSNMSDGMITITFHQDTLENLSPTNIVTLTKSTTE